MKVKTGLGLDSHRFVEGETEKPFVLGGVVFDDAPALSGNSDADVILHALTDAISGVTGVTVIGAVADKMCRAGVTDSKAYLAVALESLGDWRLSHVSIALECLRPKIDPKVPVIRESIAGLLGLEVADVCITATTGEQLNDVGRGLGIHATVIVTAVGE
ncbi:MAG: 2-C-methyl-D-erythritol 2,4-cyclodiphosphate synthase [Opitutales bacterium]|nr:2-C-methyl-D-erythritol 2,4-cyclodiphosphate synthase [Opitutales bacterium]MDP4644499.1 2-C-methyl-D-erythritol 2,4-cyclodiphosphate synthase [Opitutales bacterium]MDP4694570.1 2-C-methyl-D-erythritol 2,4-cyclodiphosphate synthase [Opitutales bacterium]MDP4777247.1 2-C-methyl-D-erythritol 2,4-cyclodiphosphate synthase [Opitutales bacterium]MDP4880232.1 2-C-methyl-D-erythritol 2,4-cyclodiphosphate synthase [Opitutales bacterium]